MAARPVSAVPRLVLAALALALAAQIGFQAWVPRSATRAEDLPRAPHASVLQLASLGDPVALAKILMLYVQAFDYQSGSRIPYRNLDYARLEQWLGRILELDPVGQYPLLAASRLYAEVPDEAKQRRMLEFVHRQFLADPNRRWPWLAHAAVLARHSLHDLSLARSYAADLRRLATAEDVPTWAQQLEIFLLEELGQLEAVRIEIGGLIQSGKIKDPAELKFLNQKLLELESRTPPVQIRK